MHLLVTGAAGFVGSATALALADRGHSVLAVDNLSPYYSVGLKELRVESLLSNPLIEFVRCDLTDLEAIKAIFKNEGFDAVIHLAAQAGVRVPISNWQNYSRDNLQAFANVLVSSAEFEVSNFMYASSSSIYGDAKQESFNEFDVLPSPLSFYGATKLANENLALATSKVTGIKTRGLRFFTVYGPWGRPDMVYFRMISSAITGEPFNFYGNGTIERDFTYVSDVVEMNCSLLEEINLREEAFADVVNIGGGRPRSINQVLEIVQSVSGVKVPYIRRESNKSDVSRTNADFSYLESLIGEHPTVAAEEGISKTFEWASKSAIKGFLSEWVKSTP